MKENINTIINAVTETVNGVKIKGIVPKVGGGWSFQSGSDSYGGKILYVSPDLSWFIGDTNCGFAKFEMRKNTIHFGKYIHAYINQSNINIDTYWFEDEVVSDKLEYFNTHYKEIFKKLKVEKTSFAARCSSHNVRYVSNTPCTTYLDPSF